MDYNQLPNLKGTYLFKAMPGPNFHHLEIFHAVARLGSFSKASEELFIGQPSVSLQIRDLERYYEAPLFHRQGRGIKLTDVGEVVFRYTQQLFQTLDEMKRSIEGLKEVVTGRLVLGASSTPGEYLVPQLLGRFSKFYPGVEVTLQIGNTSQVANMVVAHQIDLGLVGDRIDDDSLACTQFYTDELVVFASPEHPLADKGEITAERLALEPFIMREQGSATRRATERCLKEMGISIRVAMELGSNAAVKRAVAVGLGIGILSKLALEVDRAAGLLKPVDVPEFNCKRHFYILHQRNRYLSRPQEAFLDLIKDLA